MRPIDANRVLNDIGLYMAENAYLNDTALDALKKVVDWVEDAPTIDQYGTWIPCSERLPNKPEFGWDGYLVQDAYIVKPYDAYWNGKCWTDIDDNVLDNIVAWMPLPEPYGEE